jgi:phospholipase/carboxylesterase
VRAPEAPGLSWYPHSFLEPPINNEPYLSNSISIVKEEIRKTGLSTKDIFILGFSQGACLALEYIRRNPGRYKGIAALSGGVINTSPKGDLMRTPVFLGCSDIDPYIPLERVNLSEAVLRKMNAKITKKIYRGMGHTINKEEIDYVKKMMG